MVEQIKLIPKIVNGIKLDRDTCLVGIANDSDSKRIWCSKLNKRTIHGCRSRIDPRSPDYFHGCPLRDTSEEFSKDISVLDTHGLKLTNE